MAKGKKTFITQDNPALMFISKELAQPTQAPEEPIQEPVKDPTPAIEKAPDGYKLNPMYVETRTKRVQIVMQPSLYDRCKDQAKLSGISMNELVHRALTEYINKEI